MPGPVPVRAFDVKFIADYIRSGEKKYNIQRFPNSDPFPSLFSFLPHYPVLKLNYTQECYSDSRYICIKYIYIYILEV